MASKFGLGLVHRHFDMSDKEILVEHGATSTPWAIPTDPSNFMEGQIIPRSWHFGEDADAPKPYEFAFQRRGETKWPAMNQDLDAAFVEELREALQQHGLMSILGLVALPADYVTAEHPTRVLCEKTFGRANVVFELGPEAMLDKEKRTSVWTFGKFARGGRESMLCFSGCMCTYVSRSDYRYWDWNAH